MGQSESLPLAWYDPRRFAGVPITARSFAPGNSTSSTRAQTCFVRPASIAGVTRRDWWTRRYGRSTCQITGFAKGTVLKFCSRCGACDWFQCLSRQVYCQVMWKPRRNLGVPSWDWVQDSRSPAMAGTPVEPGKGPLARARTHADAALCSHEIPPFMLKALDMPVSARENAEGCRRGLPSNCTTSAIPQTGPRWTARRSGV